jgi:MFS family permease
VLPTQVTRGKGLCQGEYALTLLLMIVMWVGTCTNYFLINLYLKYIPGSEYLNITIAGVAEIVAHLSAGKIFARFGVKFAFIVGYAISLAGGVCLIFQNKFMDNVPLVAFFVLLAKFGASMCLCICQIATPWMFPTTVCGTAFGICNLFGRFMQAAAPFITELKIPLPMTIFSGLSGISLLCSLPLKQANE